MSISIITHETLKVKTDHYIEFLTPGTTKLLRSTENKIPKDENGENVPRLDIIEVVLIHCNFVNNDYEHDSRVLHKFPPKKSFSQLTNVSAKNSIFLKLLIWSFHI